MNSQHPSLLSHHQLQPPGLHMQHSHHSTTFYGPNASPYNQGGYGHVQAQADGSLRSHRQPPSSSSGLVVAQGQAVGKNKKSLINFRGTMKNNFFTNAADASGDQFEQQVYQQVGY